MSPAKADKTVLQGSVCLFQFVKQQVRDQVAGDYKEDFDAEVAEFLEYRADG